MRYCKDCRWFSYPSGYCESPKRPAKENMIWGMMQPPVEAPSMRMQPDRCGASAVWWEPKRPWWRRIWSWGH